MFYKYIRILGCIEINTNFSNDAGSGVADGDASECDGVTADKPSR